MKTESSALQPRTGWGSALARLSMVSLLFLAVSGLLVTLAPFRATVQWGLLLHTVVGVLTLLPVAWYTWIHWLDYRRYSMSHVVLLGYVGTVALLVCSLSGVIVTWQGLFGTSTSSFWRETHLISTLVTLGAVLPHVVFSAVHLRRREDHRPVKPFVWQSLAGTIVCLLIPLGLAAVYSGETYDNRFPDDYSMVYGKDRPFAPSLARTTTGGAFDPRSLAGSESCGTAGCHTQIVEEWKPSAHRYAAMDPLFQKVQSVMAEQNGPESTRYCGGCHDPISLFSGTKNIFAENLTELRGYREGVSCLSCHGIRETDLQGNANYVMNQPSAYLWQWRDSGTKKTVRDFLIRTYPAEHDKLSKRMFKKPEYCAACHKQFIDQELNRVGWVQLQNQYDNWAASIWNAADGDPRRTIECRECHMPLVASTDPAAGDVADYNRSADDHMHRSHRFIAANQLVPRLLELDGWEEHDALTRKWLSGELRVPEIQDKWAEGPIVQVALDVPESVTEGDEIPIRVILTSNKVGHDFPTGPLDIIQSWVEVRVTAPDGREIFRSGTVDNQHFIEPGSFLFKAEPIDQYGNLIDKHNLWEMVGVRYKRALFPGYSDVVEYQCPGTLDSRSLSPDALARADAKDYALPPPAATGSYEVTAALHYRKVDQYLINFLLGEESGLTAPITEISRARATVEVKGRLEARAARATGASAK